MSNKVGRRARTSLDRRLSMLGFTLVEGAHSIHALLEFDITELRPLLRKMRQAGQGGSLFAFMLKAIGKCLEEEPLFNSMIDLRRTTSFETVDIAIPIEMEAEGKVYNKQLVIRDAARKSVKEIGEEIEASRRLHDDQKGFVLSPLGRALMGALPRRLVLAGLRLILRDHERVRELSGTVFVTAVSMFSTVPGYILPYGGGPKASAFAIGSAVKKPVVRGGEIVVRELINVTASFNHDLVDGAPAARFINSLRRWIEVDYAGLLDGNDARPDVDKPSPRAENGA